MGETLTAARLGTRTVRQRDTEQDWEDILPALARGERPAVLAVTRMITAFLIRARAYDVRDSWEDLCQEVLLALVKSAHQDGLRRPQAFVAYVGSITRHKLYDWFDRNPRVAHMAAVEAVDAAAALRDEELLLDVERALGELGERERQVVEMIYLRGHSYEDAAERLRLPLGTLKRVQTGALRAIRHRLLVVRGDKHA